MHIPSSSNLICVIILNILFLCLLTFMRLSHMCLFKIVYTTQYISSVQILFVKLYCICVLNLSILMRLHSYASFFSNFIYQIILNTLLLCVLNLTILIRLRVCIHIILIRLDGIHCCVI